MIIKDKRIGTLEKFPETSITGVGYLRPCSTIGIGNGYIAVPDGVIDYEIIDELKEIVQKSSMQKREAKSKHVYPKDK